MTGNQQQRREVLRGSPLSDRELQVLRLSANGRTNPQIAAELWITVWTVKRHQQRIQARLGAADKAHAVALAFAAGILQAGDLAQAA